MALYAIGDLQGCYLELRRLLDCIQFDPAQDCLWLTGDLVNRGPMSLESLRFIRSLGKSAISVLGNHDLHLLAVACGVSKTKHKDTFGDVLDAPDREELLGWLRSLPLLHWEGGYCLVHAGIPPCWDVATAQARAREVEELLRGESWDEFCHEMYGDRPDFWSENLTGWDRYRFITNAFTRMRYCDREGRLDFKHKEAPQQAPSGLWPWFAVPGRRAPGATILFGHWSTLGFYVGRDCYGLDTGCLWGGELTALRLDGEARRYSVRADQGAYQIPSLAG